ncbi:sideroflexin-3-like isoform X1 [Petromyzon marinus]|uniref:sideroflexin-3-like isoform X1 n=1 Tax=Petromyzon marinus TaxID=7757 RepID=UPI003F726A3B
MRVLPRARWKAMGEEGSALPRVVDLRSPRWDQSTFWGRARHFFAVTDPRNLLLSSHELEQARSIVTDFRAGYTHAELSEEDIDPGGGFLAVDQSVIQCHRQLHEPQRSRTHQHHVIMGTHGERRQTHRETRRYRDTGLRGCTRSHGDTRSHMGTHVTMGTYGGMGTHRETWKHTGTHGDTRGYRETHSEKQGDTREHTETHGDKWGDVQGLEDRGHERRYESMNKCLSRDTCFSCCRQLASAYICATSGAVATALALKSLAKTLPPIMGRLVPFAAVAAANCINVPFMRQRELTHGVSVADEHGVCVSESRIAARSAIAQVVFSRVCMALPAMAIPPVIMNMLEKRPLLKRMPWIGAPVQVALVGLCLVFATPLCCALFPQNSSMPVSRLEPEVREEIWSKNPKLCVVFFNKGL